MDRNEKYMTTLIRTLIRKGILLITSTLGGELALGPAGIALGPLALFAYDYFLPTSEGQETADWSNWSITSLGRLALDVALELAITNVRSLFQIFQDILAFFKRLFQGESVSVINARRFIQQPPPQF